MASYISSSYFSFEEDKKYKRRRIPLTFFLALNFLLETIIDLEKGGTNIWHWLSMLFRFFIVGGICFLLVRV